MKTNTLPLIEKSLGSLVLEHSMIDFYEEATEDYEFWSKDLNMHFGYFISGTTSPFHRDQMLNQMNQQLYNRLDLTEGQQTVVDLGCGMGATMRYFLKVHPELSSIGVTLSPFQTREGNKRLEGQNGVILQENYKYTSLPNGQIDGVVAIESLCHSGHSPEPMKEGYRMLKKGGKMIIADAFLKRPYPEIGPISKFSHRKLCEGWSLEGLGVISEVKDSLLEMGFSSITIEDISMRVAPSVLHVPFAITGFILKKIFNRAHIKPQSWDNLISSFYALMVGLCRRDFGYYMITATK